jgi:hypothetical protein
VAETGVPVQKRVIAWITSIAIGISMYFAFASLLTAGPARERMQVRGKIDALMAEATATSPKAIKTAMALTRARLATLVAFSRREGELRQTLVHKRSWAMLIGLVAAVGCFALCSVYWLRRGAEDAGGG